jgi:hypothetical protein
MTKPNYQEFDRVLLVQIEAGRNKMMLMDAAASGLPSLAMPFRDGGRVPVFRVIDRRLQALRKAGKLRWNGKVWETTPKA